MLGNHNMLDRCDNQLRHRPDTKNFRPDIKMIYQQTTTKLYYFSTFSDQRIEIHAVLRITKLQMWLNRLLRTSHISPMSDRAQ
jgi:hypothetical protein